MLDELCEVAGHEGLPASDLHAVDIGDASSEVIPAVPLEPPAGVGGDDPPLLYPYGQGLPGPDPEAVLGDIRGLPRSHDPGLGEPLLGELGLLVVHVFALKDALLHHLFGGHVRDTSNESPPLGKVAQTGIELV